MKTFIVAKRLIKQIGGDKRSIALLFFAPVFVLFLLHVILTSSTTKPTIDIISAPKEFVSALEKTSNIVKSPSEANAISDLKASKCDAYIIFNDNKMFVTIEGSDPTLSKLAMATINKALSDNLIFSIKTIPSSNLNSATALKPEFKYLYGSESSSSFDSMAPLLMGFFIFFFVFLLAGVSFLRERISGTLDRILATPLKRSEIVLGYFFGFGLFVTLQTIVIQWVIVYGLKVPNASSFFNVLIINLLLAAGSLALGTLLSAFAKNEFQLFQFIPIVIVPQILFSGLFDLKSAPQWVIILSKIFPLTYGATALKDTMIKGYSLSEVIFPTSILLLYAIFFIVLNIVVLKKYRRI